MSVLTVPLSALTAAGGQLSQVCDGVTAHGLGAGPEAGFEAGPAV